MRSTWLIAFGLLIAGAWTLLASEGRVAPHPAAESKVERHYIYNSPEHYDFRVEKRDAGVVTLLLAIVAAWRAYQESQGKPPRRRVRKRRRAPTEPK